MAVQKNIVFKVDIEGTGKAENSIGGLEERVEKLKKLIESEPIGSKRFNELNRDLQKAQSSIKDVELQFEALDFEQKLTAGSDAIVGIAGGFAAAEGAMALFGAESEQIEKTLSKVAGALALTTGLRDLANGVIAMRKLSIATKAQAVFQELNAKATATAATVQKLFAGSVNTTTIGFKALKTAIIATGIGALVVGVGLLVANFDKLAIALGKTTREQQLSNEAQSKAIESINDELSAADKLSKTLQDETLSREQKRKEVKKFQDKYPELLSNIDAEKTSIEDINIALQKNIDLLRLKAEAEALEALRAEAFRAKAVAEIEQTRIQNDQSDTFLQKLGDITGALQGGSTAREVANQKQQDAIDAAEKEIAIIDSLTKATEDKIAAAEEDGAVGGKQAEKLNQEREKRKALRKEMQKEAEILNRINNAKFKSINQFFEIGKDAYDGEISSIKELTRALSKESEIRGKNARKLVGVQKEIADEYTTIWSEAFAEIAEMDAEAAEKRAKSEQERIDNINKGLDTASTAADGLMALNDVVLANQIKGLKEGDARRVEFERKAFERQKKLNIAMALINGAQAIVSILAQYPKFDGGFAMVAAMAAAAITTGATIAKIASTKFDSGGGSGSIGSVSSAVGGASDGANGVPINNISNTASLIDQEQQNVTQVVVVETDITNTQNTVAAVTESATF
jgi:hypothetical protein